MQLQALVEDGGRKTVIETNCSGCSGSCGTLLSAEALRKGTHGHGLGSEESLKVEKETGASMPGPMAVGRTTDETERTGDGETFCDHLPSLTGTVRC